MSIPKEPRQLMINLMYLVLTAMLALNVSAEIFNAFKVVNAGLVKSNVALDQTNLKLPAQIEKFAAKKPEFAKYKDRTAPAKDATDEYVGYIDALIDDMVKQTGGYVSDENSNETSDQRLKGEKDKDVATRVLVNEKKGDEIVNKLATLKEKLSSLFDAADKEKEIAKLALDIDPTWEHSKTHKSWASFNFAHMPLAAVVTILNKLKNDAKSSESTVLNYLMNKIGASEDIVFNNYQVVSSAKKSYIIQGEKFETDIFLSAFSTDLKGISVSVNGTPVSVVNGVAKYSTGSGAPGVKKYKATVSLFNPVSKKSTAYSNEFEYEVGLRSATVSADKMNVFYIGVENPITVSAAGISSNDLKVSATGGSLTPVAGSKGKYIVRVTREGACNISLSGGGLPPTTFPFRAKPIPNPIALIGGSSGGAMGNGTFKAQGGVEARLIGFDFDAKCVIQGFVMRYIARRQDPEITTNAGAKFDGKSSAMVSKAKPGDIYTFDNIKARCPGDAVGRSINSLSFNIR